MKTATLKDVLYGLEYAGARLCRQPTAKPGARTVWLLEPGGVRVPASVADVARTSRGITVRDSRPDGYAVYSWGGQ